LEPTIRNKETSFLGLVSVVLSIKRFGKERKLQRQQGVTMTHEEVTHGECSVVPQTGYGLSTPGVGYPCKRPWDGLKATVRLNARLCVTIPNPLGDSNLRHP
jgi:hypothetical protein